MRPARPEAGVAISAAGKRRFGNAPSNGSTNWQTVDTAPLKWPNIWGLPPTLRDSEHQTRLATVFDSKSEDGGAETSSVPPAKLCQDSMFHDRRQNDRPTKKG
ncbi:hypothetical protein AGR4A_Lc10008 [Agrobacterium tumefaciens str. B6]|uniref:Uncharacterized protein n=1 Tax=Agrobacterium tumefaciens str. B6 TaxID=1183423 RepID=A0A822V6P2_AGRTU|nr:hypothetical protein AGR4A_Lc10008 [Agrobacterium tumefaciens str. B6]